VNTYCISGFLIYMITRESIYYINLRQAYLVSPLYANRISSKTVLFTSVPTKYLNESVLREMLGPAVVRVWIPRNTKELEEKLSDRDDIALKLEGAETALVKTVNAARLKALKKNINKVHDEEDRLNSSHSETPGGVASRWITPKQRPRHRLKFLIGKSVDTIDWCRASLPKKIMEVEKLQAEHRAGKGKPLTAAFVEFNDLREAQAAYQSLTHHKPLQMSPRYTGIVPEELIWSNLRIVWWERLVRFLVTTGIVIGLVMFWTIPTAFIGSITALPTLLSRPGFGWLSFLNNLPSQLTGVVTGLLPSILLALLLMVLPMILRLMARLGGDPTLSAVEYTVQNTYFAFQVIQVFLVTTLSSGAIQAFTSIATNPTNVVTLLAAALPKSSNFYLSYFVLQGLGVVSGTVLSLVTLVTYILLGGLLDNTPRKKYNRWMNVQDPGLGTVYPIYTTLFVIAISYSCVAPLVLIFAAIGLGLFYLAYRYEFLYVYNNNIDTKGLMYPRALQQLFIGLYLAELCLIGLFATGLAANAKACLGPLVLMIIYLVFTALYHITLNTALRPLLKYLPKTLESEELRLLALEEQHAEAGDFGLYASEQTSNTWGNTRSDSRREQKQGFETEKALPLTPGSPKANSKTKIPNFVSKWLRPGVYQDYYRMRKLVPRDFATIEYDAKTEEETYYHPCITSEPPTLWIPRDEAGVSKEEVRETSKVIPLTDEGAELNHKNKIVWCQELPDKAPIYVEKVYY